MSAGRVIQGFMMFMPIALLLTVGSAIALRSGVGELSTGRDYLRMAGNLSQMLLRIVGYVAILIAVQYFVGLRPSLGW